MTDFVERKGGNFLLRGWPLRLAGANNYYLPYESLAAATAVFRLARDMGFNTLRTWAFLDGSASSERLDRVVALAEDFGMLLILPLVNYWPDFGGMPQYTQRLGLKDVHEFYTDDRAKALYRDTVKHLLTRVNAVTGRRYAEEPSILAWELANEPRYPGRGHTGTLTQWVSEMSAYVKSLDANHLVGVGDEGFFYRWWTWGRPLYNGSYGVSCEHLLELPTIDFGTFHYYPVLSGKKEPVSFGRRWIREHLAAGRRANKPMILEEFGWKQSTSSERDAAFRIWLAEVLLGEGAGALAWMIAAEMEDGRLYTDYDGYSIYRVEDAPALIEYARSVLPWRDKVGDLFLNR